MATVIEALFKKYAAEKNENEGLGAFHRRLGADTIINYLKANSLTASLMEKTFPTNTILD